MCVYVCVTIGKLLLHSLVILTLNPVFLSYTHSTSIVRTTYPQTTHKHAKNRVHKKMCPRPSRGIVSHKPVKSVGGLVWAMRDWDQGQTEVPKALCSLHCLTQEVREVTRRKSSTVAVRFQNLEVRRDKIFFTRQSVTVSSECFVSFV